MRGVVAIIEFFEEFTKGVLGFGGSGVEINGLEFFEKFCNRISGSGDGGVGEMIDTVGQSVTFNFSVYREGTLSFVIMQGHLRSVEASFAFYVVAKFGVFDDHFGPEGVAREAEKEGTFVGSDFDNDVGPAGYDVFSVGNFMIF